MIAWLARFLVQLVEAVGVRAAVEQFAAKVFIPPSPYPMPRLPAAARLIPGVERIFTQTCLDYFEKAFWAGVVQGVPFGFTMGLITVALIIHKRNVVGYAKNVVS